MTLLERLQAGGKRSGECLEWTGDLNSKGYARISLTQVQRELYGFGHLRGPNVLVSRLVLAMKNGPLKKSQQALHRCDNPKCFLEAHLFAGTQRENLADMKAKGRQRYSSLKGEACAPAKTTAEAVLGAREEYAKGNVTMKQLAERMKLSVRSVLFILRGEHWGHIGGPRIARIGRHGPTKASAV